MSRTLAPLLLMLLLACAAPGAPRGSEAPPATATSDPTPAAGTVTPASGAPVAPDAAVQDADAVARWREDVEVLAERIPAMHPNPYHTTSEAAFADAVHAVGERLPRLTDDQIIVEFMRLVALLGEGHSFLSAVQPATGFRLYPLRLYEFSDGIFVVDAPSPYEEAIGAEVVGVGGVEVGEAIRRLAPTIGRDSDIGLNTMGPVRLINANVLHALGIIADPHAPQFRLRTRAGETITINPAPIDRDTYAAWAYPPALGDLARFLAFEEVVLLGGLPQRSEPLHLRARYDENFWSTYLEASNTLYVQYNLTVGNSPGSGSIQRFSEEMAGQLEAHVGARLVLDMRHNPGGDNNTYPPLLEFLTTHPALAGPGRLYIITGRHTGSAAVNLLTDLEQRDSQALLVGEPTVSRPNVYGDPRLLRLPHSGLDVYISSRYWEKSTPDDPRDRIDPDVRIDLSSEDYFGARDPVLEWILQQPVPTGVAHRIELP